jgi:hypothetical protein
MGREGASIFPGVRAEDQGGSMKSEGTRPSTSGSTWYLGVFASVQGPYPVRHRWFTSVILSIWENETGRLQV